MRHLCLALAMVISIAPAQAQDQAFQFESDLRLLSVDLTTGSAVSTINARLGGLQASSPEVSGAPTGTGRRGSSLWNPRR